MTSSMEDPNRTIDLETGDRPEPDSTARQRRGQDSIRKQEAVVALGRRAIAPPDLPILMQDAAALLAEMLDASASGVAELSPDGQRLLRQLTPSEEEDDGAAATLTVESSTDGHGSAADPSPSSVPSTAT